MKYLIFLMISAALVSAGKCGKKKSTADHSPLVQLDQYGCRGFCPTYQLVFHNDGKVQYDGIRNTVKMGRDSFQLTQKELETLKKELEKVNLWQYPEHIKSQVADAPNAKLTVFNGDKMHEVTGSIDRPEPILNFEKMLKDLAEAHGLKVKEGVNPYAPPPNQQEIRVKFKEDVNPGNFLMQFHDVRLRIVRRLSAENEWLLGYNPDQIKEQQVIELLKGTEGVMLAEPYKK